VNESCEGRGLGSRLAEVALTDAAKENLEVVPLCPFIAYYWRSTPSISSS
jgi:predicted GNAT family acetyltransferase